MPAPAACKGKNVQIEVTTKGSVRPGLKHGVHLAVLDGWRGLSILFVLAAHLLPLGTKAWQVNYSTGILGMVIFFNLSGFLITSFLLKEQNIPSFLIRRFSRVLPLAWLYLAITLVISDAPLYTWVTHFLFYANMPPKDLLPLTDHMWSLCVEMQFYIGVAILVALLRGRGLLLLPVLCLFFTGLRMWEGVYASSVSYYRIDEILAGCVLALAYHGKLGDWLRRIMQILPQWPLFLLLVLSCVPQARWLNYCRPYLAALLIGSTILNSGTSMVRILGLKYFLSLAGISYSLYVIHPILTDTWLGSGDIYHKYEKRPLFFIVLFILAYISTHYYESRFIAWGRHLAGKFGGGRQPAAKPQLVNLAAGEQESERDRNSIDVLTPGE
ncbi:MAG TPA: acyltransferase [Janthinobacterium sp.]|jgi:peptidoglycan/LPS O-acetylase OafA/YrhL|nr:acyltransferase [Janthinobacterium sp.]